jgi:hypothetical protein
VLLLNPLEQRWTRAFVLVKINAYLLAYALFFVALFVFLLALDKSGVLKWYCNALHASSFKSRVYMPHIVNVNRANKRGSDPVLGSGAIDASAAAGASASTDKTESRGALLLQEILRSDIQRRVEYDDLIQEVEGALHSGAAAAAGELSTKVSRGPADGGSAESSSKSDKERTAKENKLFDDEFHDYLLLKRCYLGCSAVLFEGGLRIPVLGVALREGLAENFLLYVMNNHSIVSCAYACKQSSHSRNSRRWVLIVQHAVGFFVTNIVGVLFLLAGVGAVYSQATAQPATSYFASQLFDIFVASPIALAFGEVFRRLYRCDVSVSTIEKYPRYVKALTAVRKGLVIPLIILGVFALLVICAVLTTGQSRQGNIVSYMRDVFLVTVVLDLVCAALSFVSTHHYAVYLFGGRLCLLSVGQLYVELLLADGKRQGVDYKVSSYSRVGGLVRIDNIADIAECSSSRQARVVARASSFTQVNPMHQRKTLRAAEPAPAAHESDSGGGGGVATIEMSRLRPLRALPASTIVEEEEEEEEDNNSGYGSAPPTFDTLNPMLSGASRDLVSKVTFGRSSEGGVELADMLGSPRGAEEAPGDPDAVYGSGSRSAPGPHGASRLQGRRASFVRNLNFFEQRFAAQGRHLSVDMLKKSMVAEQRRSGVGGGKGGVELVDYEEDL